MHPQMRVCTPKCTPNLNIISRSKSYRIRIQMKSVPEIRVFVHHFSHNLANKILILALTLVSVTHNRSSCAFSRKMKEVFLSFIKNVFMILISNMISAMSGSESLENELSFQLHHFTTGKMLNVSKKIDILVLGVGHF